jgi:hypothetical protein
VRRSFPADGDEVQCTVCSFRETGKVPLRFGEMSIKIVSTPAGYFFNRQERHMSERIKWIDCEGFTIMSVDYSDLPEEEYLDTMEEAIQLLRAFQGLPSESPMLVMDQAINTHTTERVVDRFREILTVLGEFNGHAYAVVGSKDIIKRLAKVSASNIYFTGTEQDARNWLVKQAKRLVKK